MSLRFRRHWGTGNENTGLLMLRLERETGLSGRYGGVIDDDDVDDDEAYY